MKPRMRFFVIILVMLTIKIFHVPFTESFAHESPQLFSANVTIVKSDIALINSGMLQGINDSTNIVLMDLPNEPSSKPSSSLPSSRVSQFKTCKACKSLVD